MPAKRNREARCLYSQHNHAKEQEKKTIKCFMSLVTLVWKPAIRLGEWTCVFLRMSTDGQLLLKKPIQECMHCQDTAT